MNSRHSPTLRATLFAFTLSILLHCTALLLLSVQTLAPSAPALKRPTQSMSVPLISEQELRKLRYKTPQSRPKPKKEEREVQVDQKAQIVDIPPPPVERIPTQSRFVAEYNNSVREEMLHRLRQAPQPQMQKSDRISTSRGKDIQGSRRGKRDAIRDKKKKQPKKISASQSPAPRGVKQPAESPKPKARRSELHDLKKGEGQFAPSDDMTSEQTARQVGTKEGEDQAKGLGRLTPTHHRSLLPALGPQDLAALDGSIDHVPDMQRGDQTALNTRESRYAFFFNRVKRAVSIYWSPATELRRLDPRGEVYGVRDRHTVLAVTLNPNGSIADLRVERSSGIPELDRTTVASFLQAQPFHNPPKGLIEKDGLIHFKFGFFLEINARGFKLFP